MKELKWINSSVRGTYLKLSLTAEELEKETRNSKIIVEFLSGIHEIFKIRRSLKSLEFIPNSYQKVSANWEVVTNGKIKNILKCVRYYKMQ